MSKYIKYKRIVETFNFDENNKVQEFFDRLIKEGWEIIYYTEKTTVQIIIIIVVVGKKQSLL